MNDDGNKFICTYCLKPLNLYFIKCVECRNIILCIPCFSYGIQGGTHKKNHIYSVKVCNEDTEVFIKSNWSISEEKKLLDAIELYGVGNWNDISLKVESHPPDDCRDHYINFYINSPIGKYLLGNSRQKTCQVSDHSVNVENSTLSPSLYEIMPPCNLSVDDQVILGYMPKRDDFERDYDNDAESILCRLKPDFIKDDLLDALKVAHVGIYTQRLKERQRRKLIAREHDLIGPIMSCILNKRWKPPALSINPSESAPTDSATSDSAVRTKPFSIISSNTLDSSSTNEKNLRKSRKTIDKSLKLSSTVVDKKNRPNDLSNRNRPYDAFMINENLKPFLRYLTYSQAKALLENLHREEILKFEILNIINAVKRGRRKIFDMPIRHPTSSHIFVKSRPRLLPATNGNGISILTQSATPQHPHDTEDGSADHSGHNGQLHSKFISHSSVSCVSDLKKKTRRRRKARPYFFIRKRRR